jgi:GTPase SAR1 family protein
LVDLSSLVLGSSTFPPLLPSPVSLAALGYARHFPVVRFAMPRAGIVLGDIPTPFADAEVRFAPSDRSQHCYVIGATGTGKSTLLRRMIEQDIAGGEGLALIDPHGDLYEQVLSAIPARRKNDVVLLDFTDNEHYVGLNFLECVSAYPDREKSFIIHQLAEIFWSLYAYVPESMGPAFQQYMHIALVMEDPGKDLTLLEVPLVFADPTFRNYLLAHCSDEQVADFWQGIASRTTGENSLANMAAYITNKFTEFTQNQLVRMVVGQSRSSIDFQRIMDERRVLLVNLSKGLLSESDSKFLGMLVTGRLFAAAMARASARRTPFYVYMDEFQNFTTPAVTQALAEMRKFGLSLTLAHQNLSQLPEQLREAVLANIGSRIFLRVGAMDAKRLAEFVSPHFGERDLVALPDHHAVARIKVDNVPSPAFAMRTRRLEGGSPTPAQQAITKDVIARSRAKYCRTVPEIRNEIAWRRARHVLRMSPAALGFSATACDFLKAHNVRVLSDLAGPDSPVMRELTTQKLPTNDAALFEKVKAALRAQAERENA